MPRHEFAPVLVFDLDGTILRVNSFARWAIFMVFGRLPGLGVRQRARLSCHVQARLLRRKLLRTGNDELVRELQAAWQGAYGSLGAQAMARFEVSLLRYLRLNLAPTLTWVRTEGIDAVLATAAASEYAEGLGRLLGFRYVLATAKDRAGDEPTNRGERKCERVLGLLAQEGWKDRPLVLFTDHEDDVPLMRVSRIVYWFGGATFLPRVVAAAPNARFMSCRALDGETLHAILCAECTRLLAAPAPVDDGQAFAMTAS